MPENKDFLHRFVANRLTSAIVAILIGLLFIALPDSSADVLCLFAGLALLACAIMSVVNYFNRHFPSGSPLVLGILLALGGLLCLFNPTLIKGLLGVIFGFYLILEGARTLTDAIDCIRARYNIWPVLLVLALVTLIFGIVVLFGNFSTLLVFAGIALLVDGVCALATLGLFGRRLKEIRIMLHGGENPPPPIGM